MLTLGTYKHELYEEIKYMTTQVDEGVCINFCLFGWKRPAMRGFLCRQKGGWRPPSCLLSEGAQLIEILEQIQVDDASSMETFTSQKKIFSDAVILLDKKFQSNSSKLTCAFHLIEQGGY